VSISQHFPVLVILLPLISAVLIPILSRAKKIYSWYISSAATFFSFMISVSLLRTVLDKGEISYWLGNWEPPWGIEYVVDYLSGFVLVVISFIIFVITLYSRNSVDKEIPEDKVVPFYSIYMLFVAGLLGMIVTGDIFNLYVFIEISSLAGYALIAVGRKRDALIASYNYLILGTIAATFILLGIGYLYMMTGTLNMADLRERLPALYNTTVIRTAFAFFSVGLSIKIALFPLHIWLPNAYTHAPSVIAALQAATATKVGVYAMIRIMFTVFKPEFILEVVPVANLFLVLSAVAIIAGSLLAFGQKDIRRVLAYSSIGQIGYIVMGIALANRLSIIGSLIHILNHALMKGGLFLVVGAVVYKTGITDIDGFKGLGKKMPFSMAAFTICAFSMVGIPLTAGFVSKWYLALGALQAEHWTIVPVILISSLLTAIYFWRIIDNIYFDGHEVEGKIDDAPSGMLVPTFALAFCCILFGIVASIPVNITGLAAEMLVGG
jgi:multicomponent Na+:H+ antiporter subunit D